MDKITTKNQSGFIIIMGMLVLVLGAALWFGSISSLRSQAISIEERQGHIEELQRIKQRMLIYAAMQPEIFRTDSGSNAPRNQVDIPGPGYFPCPDLTGDGDSNAPCTGNGNNGFVIGLIPESTSTRGFTFIDENKSSNRYWFAVDERFLTQNSAFNFSGSSSRFVPLNSSFPDLTFATGSPSLTLDGNDDIVMILIYAGEALDGQVRSEGVVSNITQSIANYLELENNDLKGGFISSVKASDTINKTAIDFNDYVISINRREWNAAMLSRVAKDVLNLIDNTETTFWIDRDGDGLVSLMDFDANNDGRVEVNEIEGDGSPDLCDLLEDGPTGDMHWFNECLFTGSPLNPPSLVPSCTFNSINTNENRYGQNWRSELGC